MMSAAAPFRPTCHRRGVTLTELLVVSTVVGVLATIAVPQYHRSVEQARVNTAAQHLRSIWSAQRLFWLEHRAFSDSLPELGALGFIAPEIAAGSANFYSYQITSATTTTFTVTATREGSDRWSGTLQIQESGQVTGAISGSGAALTPADF